MTCNWLNRIALPCLWLLAASAQTGTWEAEGVGGRIVRDPAHKQALAVEIWGDSNASVATGRLAPGVYRVTLQGRFLGEPNTRYSLAVSLAMGDVIVGNRSFWPMPNLAGSEYQRLEAVWIVRQAGAGELRLALKDHAREEDAKAVAEAKLRAMAKPALGAANDDDGEFKLEDRPLPAGSESFLLSRASLEPLPMPLVVTRLWPDRIHYFPDDQARIEVDVWNPGKAPATGDLTVALVRDLDTRQEVLSEAVTVPGGETVTRSVSLPLSGEYGYEAVAAIAPPAPAQPHTARDYFSVSENVFEVSIQGWGRVGVLNDQESLRRLRTMPQADLDALSRESARQARRGYYNHVEFFSWAPDDFFNLSPEEDAWWSGTMTYIKVKRDILAELRALQAEGIKVLAYAQPFAIGLDTQRNLRTHPEFFAYNGDGSPAVGYDYDILKSRARLDMGLRPQEVGGGLNFFDIRTVDRGTDALIACWKMFGFDGVRFDNRYYRANNPITMDGTRATTEMDLDPYSARNVRRQKERFREAIGPRWLISHNNGYRFHTEDNKLGWEETVKDGLMCMDEETCNADSPSSNLNDYLAFMRFAVEARRACTELGGYYQLFPPGRGNTVAVDMAFYPVACAATGSHPISCDVEGSPAGPYGRFFTRYSAFLFARDIVPLANPTRLLAFPDLPEGTVWWEDFASQRQLAGRRWLLFPLAMAPAERRFSENLDSTLTRTPEAIPLVFTPGQPAANRRYRLLSPELPGMAADLTPAAEGETVRLTLPRLNLFGLLVIEETIP